jgi:hypothetical protein
MRTPSILLRSVCFLVGTMLLALPPSTLKLEIQKIQSMDFGGLKAGSEGGSVILNYDGARIPGGDIRLGTGPSHPAIFRLLGPPNGYFSLNVTPESPLLNPPVGRVRVHDFLCSDTNFQGSFDGTGVAEIRLGGTLDIGTLQKPGHYSESHVELHLHSLGFQSATQSFEILANLQPVLILTNESPMNFGSWIAMDPGRVALNPLGPCTSLDPGGPVFAGGRPNPATFTIRAQEGTCYTLRLPDQIVLRGFGPSMEVTGFNSSIPSTGVMDNNSLSFRVGATLHVGAKQAIGRYMGTFDVTVFYF